MSSETSVEFDHDLSGVRVSDNRLIVPSQVVLPRHCVKTGRRLQAKDMRAVVLEYSAPVEPKPQGGDPYGFVDLLSLPVSIFVGWYLPRRCKIYYGVSRGPRIWLYLHCLLRYGLMLAIAVGCLVAWWYNQQPVICLLAPCGLLLLLRWVVLPSDAPLKIIHYSDGQFHIAGCGPKFLQVIADLQANSEST